MNLLYISNLNGLKYGGPNFSVPSQVISQSKIDNVFWYNINDNCMQDISNGEVICHTIKEFPSRKISDLTPPFNKPDLVIFEGLYFPSFIKIGEDCKKNHIPYIIIPRSSLTQKAQQSKRIKKLVGNALLFKKFIRHASAIQYLTKDEYEDSGEKWNSKQIIIPNGVDKKSNVKEEFDSSSIKGVFIARLDIYQKGLDLLLEACFASKNELTDNKIVIYLYGPDKKGSMRTLIKKINELGLNKLVYIRGSVFDSEKEKVLLDSDFFILTSRFEGHPMGLIEALSYGLPSLITTGTNMAEEIKATNAGWTAEVTANSIELALKKLISEKEGFEKKSKNALVLSELYNWDKLAQVSHNKYKELLGRDY